MMSSEEDPEPQSSSSFPGGSAASKSSANSSRELLSSASSKKRVRQRVDAGEPRNSYASIPNFSSRPGCSPLAALYSNGFAASKMLCDLLGSSATSRPQEDMIVLDGPSSRGMFVCDMERCSSESSTGSNNSHLLRDILQQGRGGADPGHGPLSPRPNLDDDDSSDGKGSMATARAATTPPPADSPDWPSAAHNDSSLESKRARVETIVSNMMSVPKTNGSGQNGLPETQASVNGCKKRKLYQPQQHEKRVNGDGGESFNDENGDGYDDEDGGDDVGSSPVVKRRNMSSSNNNNTNGSTGLFTFKQQLRHMQQQLVAMQQQYMEMVDGDSTDEENNNNIGNNTTNNNGMDDRPKSADSTDMKPAKTEPVSYVDYDNASMYDNGDHPPRRLVIDDSSPKDNKRPSADNRLSCLVQNPSDYEWLAESLKAELSTSLSQVVDAVVSRCVQRKASLSKLETSTPIDHSNKDPTLLSQMLDRKSPRTGKVIDRGTRLNGGGLCGGLRTSPYPPQDLPGTTPKPPFFFPLKPPASVAATAAFLYGSPPVRNSSPPSSSTDHTPLPEQTEAMSLVVASKKKRHKVTDTRLRPPMGGPPQPSDNHLSPSKYPDHPSLPPLYHHPPPPLVPVSLPTSVAIPNPSLNQSELFHGYEHHHYRLSQHFASLESTPRGDDDDVYPQVHHPLHPLLAPLHRGSPDYSNHLKQDSGDMSDAGDSQATYDSSMAMISFLPSSLHTSTLTPMHLRKAKLMFFFARYPSSAVLKMYFPDIRFNKNNTAQLVKWFSNFREFFYIQMEKYARQAITEGVKTAEELKVNADSELLRVLNLHYNRNNHIPSPEQFRFVVEQTLREFYKALVAGKDSEQSWKKSIYKIIARMDDSVPDYFKSPNFLDTLE